MTYENLVKAAKKAVKVVDASVVKEHLAVEFDIEGKGEGAFYVEFKENAVEVEPYEYYDHDFRVRSDAKIAMGILKGEVSPIAASEEGKIVVEGSFGKLELLEKYLNTEVKPKKTTRVKEKVKETAKTTAKTAAKTTKESAKAVAKKADQVAKETVKATKTTVKAAKETAKETAKDVKEAVAAKTAKAAEKKPVSKKVEKKPAAKTVK